MKTIQLTESELVEIIQQIVTEKKKGRSKRKSKKKKGRSKRKSKKKDRCHRCADQSYGPETSAYKSGAMVKCRQGKIWKGKKC